MIVASSEPIRRDLDVALQSWLGPQARAHTLAQVARDILQETDARNAAALGQIIPHQTFVDGIKTESLDHVRADGVIVRVYDVMPLLLMQVGTMLWTHSPYKTGQYRSSHRLFADGSEIAEVRDGWQLPSLPSGVREFMFAPTVRYARPIEYGWSKQTPDGVYHVVAVLAQPVFGSFAKIAFDYREVAGLAETKVERRARPGKPRDMRQPVIIIQPS